MKELANVAKEIPRAILECKCIYTDIKNLAAAIESMSNPITYLYHVERDILVNGV